MSEQQNSTLTIRIPEDLKRSAEIVAKQRDESLSQVIRKHLREYIGAGGKHATNRPAKGGKRK